MRMHSFHNIGFKYTEMNEIHTHRCLSREWTASKFVLIGNLFHSTMSTYSVHVFLGIEKTLKMFPHLASDGLTPE